MSPTPNPLEPRLWDAADELRANSGLKSSERGYHRIAVKVVYVYVYGNESTVVREVR